MKYIKQIKQIRQIRQIKQLSLIAVLFTSITLCSISFADTSQMNATLARISTILNQVNPLINLAAQQEDPNVRVKFQFDALRQDIASIQIGIAQAINRVSIQPRSVTPLSGDYLPETTSKTNQEDNTP